ncbi:sugar phosphate isomerase/epimerase family protein [Persicitalea jodogahamensis]|uniref:Xylose isomerase-like TIM barrel domain-containing protein n=1 Tax=Persicitalea jodogahamensis TaxID=402147 RepID=A0A8J3DB12_9BACT|nr:TIM barrel protein [Persicitalea jodogahamensis]GHB70908.1 hypothetical protein GCM10007390_25790 [Persicitalea jodogahamensis]
MQNQITRRNFIQKTTFAAGTLPFLAAGLPAFSRNTADMPVPKIHVFSKHLQFLDYDKMAEMAAEIGFDGVDLTVRPGGHVLPERVEEDLPKAIAALKKHKLPPQLFCTAVEGVGPLDKKVLETAAKHGLKYYRMNWYDFDKEKTMPESLEMHSKQMKALGDLNKKLGLIGCYQNHAGLRVGASPWEIYQLLEDTDPGHMGAQYDIRHATVEGGLSWKNSLRLLEPRIKTIVFKDFAWVEKNGKWEAGNTPLGEGMVDFKSYIGLLKNYQLNVPISLHYEYPLGGAEHGATTLKVDQKVVFDAMRRDLTRLKEMWKEA